MRNVLFIVLMVLALLVSGCNEAQRPVYGQGDPGVEFQKFFGNDNGARLACIQNQIIVELRDKTIKDIEVRIKALEAAVLPKPEKLNTKLIFNQGENSPPVDKRTDPKELITRFNEAEPRATYPRRTDPTRKYREVTK